MTVVRIRLATLAAVMLAAAACGPDCIDETRGLNVSGSVAPLPSAAAPGDTGSVGIVMSESRNHMTHSTSYRRISWSVRAWIPLGTITSVELRETSTDRLLFTFPAGGGFGEHTYAETNTGGVDYTGDVSWDDFYSLVGSGHAYVIVRSTKFTGGHMRGIVNAAPAGTWESFVHSYCS